MIIDFMQMVYRELAPGGTLRAAININSAVAKASDAGNGRPSGTAIDLLEELGRRLGLPTQPLAYEGVRDMMEAGKAGAWDLAFLAKDPEHARHFLFTPPYVGFEGSYLVRDDSPVRTVLDLDRSDAHIAVAEGATYDLYLTRTLRRARLVRTGTFKSALAAFQSDRLDAVAGLKHSLNDYAATHAGLRVIEGRFAVIEHAIAVPRGHRAALRYLTAFTESEMAAGRGVASLDRG